MTALNARISLSMSVAYQNALDNQTPNGDLARTLAIDLTNGTGSGKAQSLFSDLRSLSSGANENLDLAGTLVDCFGNVITFTKIKALIFESDPLNTVDITIGNHASAAFYAGLFAAATNTVTIQPGGLFVIVAPQTGYTVTATTADMIKVLAGAAAVNYRVHIIGE